MKKLQLFLILVLCLICVGQAAAFSMYDQTSNRVMGTIYQNTTGSTLTVSVTMATANTAFDLLLTINPTVFTVGPGPWTSGGTIVDHKWVPANLNAGQSTTVGGIVPPGYYYGVSYLVAAPGTLSHWIEWY